MSSFDYSSRRTNTREAVRAPRWSNADVVVIIHQSARYRDLRIMRGYMTRLREHAEQLLGHDRVDTRTTF
ncbi:hypothetical protein M404DRAFT_998497 [Pisolithus tinctorius Marx 270]|uniref:Uncharacterized protein n=1 Tax=Pisolithus tinctorius Marx 270 TaxID=870435 RepID=A0A0C3PFI9_PISTI|nr:hypothetical protein M404DRAFT_998497 [Pisolithus tinctorius Marx 270]